MFSLTPVVLSQIWGGIIVFALLTYVVLDGFDLGVGILFPFAPSRDCRDKMMNSIAPFWDGNETWLVLGGGGLLAAFPQAFGVICSALYLPITYMLIALVFRGVAFEFRFKSEKTTKLWDVAFHFGSLIAAFMQGIIVGSIVQGITVKNGMFAGNSYDWLTAFSLTTGVSLVFAYSLLGACWAIYKTSGKTQIWGLAAAKYSLIHVSIFLLLVCLWTPQLEPVIFKRWFSTPNIYYLWIIPVLTTTFVVLLTRELRNLQSCSKPFFLTLGIYFLTFGGLIVSIWPYIVPHEITFMQAAAHPKSQFLMLIGVLVTLPLILTYTIYNYYVFRGKANSEPLYG